MHNPSTVTNDSSSVYDFVSQLGDFPFSSSLQSFCSDGYASSMSNFLFFDGFGGSFTKKKSKFGASLNLSCRGGSSIRRIVSEFNRAIRFHCERIPIGFASVRIGNGDDNGSSDNNGAGDNNNGIREDGCTVLEDNGLPLNVVETEKPKKVLILMSDTGGGHRASAEAIKAAFNEEFEDEYQVSYNAF